MKKIFSILLCAILFLSLLTFEASAAELNYYPPLPQVVHRYPNSGEVMVQWNYYGVSEYHYFWYSSSYPEQRSFYLQSGSSSNSLNFDFGDYGLNMGAGCELHHYKLSSDLSQWVLMGSYYSENNGTHYNFIYDKGNIPQFLFSSEDIYQEGEVFFTATPSALHREIHRVAEGVLQRTNLLGAMKILIPFGVGLMALLVGLVLFGKVSRTLAVK